MSGKTRRPIDVVPYPQKVEMHRGETLFGRSSDVELPAKPDRKESLGARMIGSQLGGGEGDARVRVGSLATLEKGQSWIKREQRAFLAKADSDQAYVLTINRAGATIVGKGPQGALYGVQTFLQLLGRGRRRRAH